MRATRQGEMTRKSVNCFLEDIEIFGNAYIRTFYKQQTYQVLLRQTTTSLGTRQQ